MLRKMLIASTLLLAGCISLDPHYVRPAAPVPAVWPNGQSTQPQLELTEWQATVKDDRLKQVVSRALKSNRDLRQAIADIEAARALYGEKKAALYPALDAGLSSSRSRSISNGVSEISGSAEASGSVSSFELDLFGKNRSLSRAAKESWLASAATAKNTRITLIAETTTAWITLAADQSSLALAKVTMQSAADTVKVTKRRLELGADDGTAVNSAITIYQQARGDVAGYTTSVAQDINALNLLVGESMPDSLLPDTLEPLEGAITIVPSGVSSEVLLRRPDVQEAEHELKSANADIGSARAAFFPSLTLTASAGVGSSSLSNLFGHGSNVWSFAPSLTLPIFAGGENLAALRYAEAEKKGYIAAYEKAIQSAFKDVADALASRATLQERLDAQDAYVAAAMKSYHLSDLRYRNGVDSYLNMLVAQRTLYAAQQDLISLKQTDYENRITLWQSLGGGI
ncbi:multidrug efflux system outer membrane protein|uniref:Multidrug efflux system outer membrane protein n=1 Tax=Brenneria salicis ATCC 15712 = DSM 30166 TaxID=714314 RepID=A0A366I315_9GAMM|nr:TolC family protein [Brenneria salicis]NMN92994.1 multidrug efflux system outer membrane protein [Brenneria salicis ATCC 15712 = DSM 30166]RBP61967.1 multidrug efflux system outer membrane protein [Brenneria salicis ATCC 15712 = DSM 30166]RLM31229.1 multidrug transporter [Brenneria salicis ATCC 15712 = DSM 30166]